MKIIIAGCGKVGDAIIDFLSKEDHEITVIDTKYDEVEQAVNNYDVIGVEGNAASYEVLMSAGADKADVFIVTTDSDELNLMACLVAKKLGAKNTLARVRNPEYANQIHFMRTEFGVDLMFNPEKAAAREISRIIQFPAALHSEHFAKGKVNLCEIAITKDSPLIDKPLSALSSVTKAKVLICAVKRQDKVIIPDGSFVLKEGDIIDVSARFDQVNLFARDLKIITKKIKSAMIVGGGRISFYLANILSFFNIDIKIIEKDEVKCRELAELLPKATIIHGDGTDNDLLLEEGLEETDAIISLTGIDEQNIIISLIANNYNVRKVISKVTRISFMKMLPQLDLNCSIISPKYISASHILQYVRGIQNSQGSNVEALHKIIDNQAEALQFIVKDSFEYKNIALKDLKLKKGLLIAGIIRNNAVIHPDGNSFIASGDRVIIVSSIEGLRDLKDIVE